MNQFDFSFTEIAEETSYYASEGCSGSRSDCCTRVCRENDCNSSDSLESWDKYLEVNAGVIQY